MSASSISFHPKQDMISSGLYLGPSL